MSVSGSVVLSYGGSEQRFCLVNIQNRKHYHYLPLRENNFPYAHYRNDQMIHLFFLGALENKNYSFQKLCWKYVVRRQFQSEGSVPGCTHTIWFEQPTWLASLLTSTGFGKELSKTNIPRKLKHTNNIFHKQ